MNFKWAKGKNFLSIGEEGIHISFDELGSIVVVKGQNLDISPQSSNGAGKSTIIELLIYGLFGKLIKGLPHKEAINKKTKKKLEVEVCFEIDGIEHRIVRGRKPDFLHLFKNGEDVTVGGAPHVQKEIESIVRLNYESFINVVCFGEHNHHAFLACDPGTKRVIVENLLGLEKYVKYCDTAKKSLKAINERLTIHRKKYEGYTEQRDALGKHIAQLESKQLTWTLTKQKEVEEIQVAIDRKEKEISNSVEDSGAFLAYQQAQERLRVNKDDLVKYEESRCKIAGLADEIKTKLDLLQESKTDLTIKIKEKESQESTKRAEIRLLEKQMNKLSNLQPGVTCGVCYGTVDQKNYDHIILHNNEQTQKLNTEIADIVSEVATLKTKLKSILDKITTISDTKKQADTKMLQVTTKMKSILEAIQKDSQVKEPQTGAKTLVLAEQLSELKRKLASKLDELDKHDPYMDILSKSRTEIVQLEAKITEINKLIDEDEATIPYHEFWIEGFGDDGIRALIIDDVLPALNARINYWLQFLIDNKIQLTFDNTFEATIQRNPIDGDPFVYNATSGGERRRINLANSQAFAHVMMISAGIYPNIISLDEVALNVDVPGVHGIYKMIVELSRDRKVFVTTHDPNLADLLNSCDVLTVVKQDGFSTILKEAA
jgi:DNA repair exonuclease SbcCD ATPase subunit